MKKTLLTICYCFMSSGIASLHKILKDETGWYTLTEKGKLVFFYYVEMMEKATKRATKMPSFPKKTLD